MLLDTTPDSGEGVWLIMAFFGLLLVGSSVFSLRSKAHSSARNGWWPRTVNHLHQKYPWFMPSFDEQYKIGRVMNWLALGIGIVLLLVGTLVYAF